MRIQNERKTKENMRKHTATRLGSARNRGRIRRKRMIESPTQTMREDGLYMNKKI